MGTVTRLQLPTADQKYENEIRQLVRATLLDDSREALAEVLTQVICNLHTVSQTLTKVIDTLTKTNPTWGDRPRA